MISDEAMAANLRMKPEIAPPIGTNWTPEQRGRALYIVWILANTPPGEWQNKKTIYAALDEFRRSSELPSEER